MRRWTGGTSSAGLTALAGSTAAASALLPLLENNYALAQVVPPDRCPAGNFPHHLGWRVGRTQRLSGEAERCRKAAGRHRHPRESRIEPAYRGHRPPDCAGRLPGAGTRSAEPARRHTGGRGSGAYTDRPTRQQLRRSRIWCVRSAYLQGHAGSTGKVGTVGFCWGGGMVNSLATASPDLNAGVVFYGRTPPLEDVPKIHAKLLLNYAGLDDRINEGTPGIRGGAEEGQCRLHAAHLPGRQPRLQQRHQPGAL